MQPLQQELEVEVAEVVLMEILLEELEVLVVAEVEKVIVLHLHFQEVALEQLILEVEVAQEVVEKDVLLVMQAVQE